MAAASLARISNEPILPPGVATWLRYVKSSADEVHLSLIALQELVAQFAPWNAVLSRFSSLSIQLNKLYGLVFGGGPEDEDAGTARARELCRRLLLKPQLGPEGLLSADVFRSSKDFFEVTEKLKKAVAEAAQVFGDFGLGSSGGGSEEKEDDADVLMGGVDNAAGAGGSKGVFLIMDHINDYNREVINLKQLALMHKQMSGSAAAHEAEADTGAPRGQRSSHVVRDLLVSQLNSTQFGHRLR